MDLIANFAKTISQYGPANFIYSDGEYLFTHGHIRKQLGKEGFHPPGLFTLKRSCQPGHSIETIQGLEFADRNQQQEVVLVASVPLTKENWKPLAEGELLVLMNGKIIDSGMDLANKKLTSPANYRNSA